MRRALMSLIVLPALLSASATHAHAGGLDVRLGAFIPRARACGIPSDQPAKLTLFQDVCELYVPTSRSLDDFDWKDEWVGFSGGAEYNQVLIDNVELGVHVDGYARSVDTSYRDYTWDDGTEIFQTLRLNVVPIGATLRLVPTSKRAKVAPYVGGGVDLVYYKYEEFGDFIDFFDPEMPIYSDAFLADGVTFGFHAAGGLRFYLNRDFAIVVEGRYLWAEADMGDDFSPNEPGLVNRIDLGGASAVVGLHIRF
jgi:opacity protein-like surface antigen